MLLPPFKMKKLRLSLSNFAKVTQYVTKPECQPKCFPFQSLRSLYRSKVFLKTHVCWVNGFSVYLRVSLVEEGAEKVLKFKFNQSANYYLLNACWVQGLHLALWEVNDNKEAQTDHKVVEEEKHTHIK